VPPNVVQASTTPLHHKTEMVVFDREPTCRFLEAARSGGVNTMVGLGGNDIPRRGSDHDAVERIRGADRLYGKRAK